MERNLSQGFVVDHGFHHADTYTSVAASVTVGKSCSVLLYKKLTDNSSSVGLRVPWLHIG